MHSLTCAGCSEAFEAKSPRAKWCKPACKKRSQRSGFVPAKAGVDTPSPDDSPEHALVATTRRELAAAGRTDTFAGQLALQLAKRLADPAESGVSALSKELRTVMAAALEGVTPPSAEPSTETEPEEPVEDDVKKARRRREEARQAAGLA